ncbi:MAG: ribosome recycling factor [Patescibacteria group bacterium]|jgi:ribosome recycling factor
MMDNTLLEKPVEHLRQELAGIRSGRATPGLVENLTVEVYDSKSSLKELASITTPEPQSLLIQPWDATILKNIERAIRESSIGIEPINDGRVIRIVIPPLTEERRNEFIRVVKQKAEEARVALRSIREKEMKEIKKSENDGAISEDESTRMQKKLQEEIDAFSKKINGLVESKEKEMQI